MTDKKLTKKSRVIHCSFCRPRKGQWKIEVYDRYGQLLSFYEVPDGMQELADDLWREVQKFKGLRHLYKFGSFFCDFIEVGEFYRRPHKGQWKVEVYDRPGQFLFAQEGSDGMQELADDLWREVVKSKGQPLRFEFCEGAGVFIEVEKSKQWK